MALTPTPPVRLAEIIGVLSLATDLGTGMPFEHGLRSCLLALRLADALGLSSEQASSVYYVTLLRFIGCTDVVGLSNGRTEGAAGNRGILERIS